MENTMEHRATPIVLAKEIQEIHPSYRAAEGEVACKYRSSWSSLCSGEGSPVKICWGTSTRNSKGQEGLFGNLRKRTSTHMSLFRICSILAMQTCHEPLAGVVADGPHVVQAPLNLTQRRKRGAKNRDLESGH